MEIFEQLEDMVDRTSLSFVIYTLGDVCTAKERMWEGEERAQEWREMAILLGFVFRAVQQSKL